MYPCPDLRVVWAAGFFDGEGCVSLSRKTSRETKSGYRYRLTLQVSQVKQEPLLVLRDLWGGTLSHHKGINLNQQDYYSWTVEARKAEKALVDILPYLIGKKKQAKLALEFMATFPGNRKDMANTNVVREAMKSAMHLLNRRGV